MSLTKWFANSISNICHFWYTAAIIGPVKSTPRSALKKRGRGKNLHLNKKGKRESGKNGQKVQRVFLKRKKGKTQLFFFKRKRKKEQVLTDEVPRLARQPLWLGARGQGRRKISLLRKDSISKARFSYALVLSLCLNLLPFVVCLFETLSLYCAKLLRARLWRQRVLNGLVCKYRNTCSSAKIQKTQKNSKIQKHLRLQCENLCILPITETLAAPMWKFFTVTNAKVFCDHLNNKVAEFLQVTIALPRVVIYSQYLRKYQSIFLAPQVL